MGSALRPWPATCTSGHPLVSLPLRRFMESAATTAPAPLTGLLELEVLQGRPFRFLSRKNSVESTVGTLLLICGSFQFQALEGLKLAEKDPNGGRRLTSQGRRDLDRIAAQIKLAAAEKAKKAAAAEAVIAIA